MGGSVTFQEALAARLGVMQPSQQDIERFLQQHPPKVGTLGARGADVGSNQPSSGTQVFGL
jgi:phosphoserine phosphatase